MTTFFLVRHGQSTWNAERRWQGQANPPLSELGRSQAFEAARSIGQVDLVIASPQLRAMETAMIIADSIGVGPIIAVDDLRERNAGSWSGLTVEEIEAQYPGWLAAGRRPDDFEPGDALEKRVLQALHQLANEYADATMLVVTHGGVIHSIEETFGQVEGRVPNVGGRIVHADKTSWSLGDRLRLIGEPTGGSPEGANDERL
ncbi:MAG: histidine phosphatase family protein [Acidimicrobiales bacterium]